MEDKNAYIFIVLYLILGVITYDFVQNKIGFSYTDELLAVFLLMAWFLRAKSKSNGMYFVLFVFVLYLLNSLLRPNNVIPAIFSDFIQQLKPFIGFFTILDLGLTLDSYYKVKLCRLCEILAVIVLPVGLINIGGGDIMDEFLGGYARYSTICVCLGSTYFVFSEHKKKDIVIMLLIFSIGLLGLRSKMFGLYAASVVILLFWKIDMNSRLVNPKTIVFLVIGICAILWAAWDKVHFYFIEGFEAENMFARPMLYVKSLEILHDFPFLGSGFGSYATDASAQYYSPLYFKYNLYLSPEIGNGLFISDTYFPVLAQFGYIGVALFLYFWYWIIKQAKYYFDYTGNIVFFKMVVLIVVFFFIESIADSTFTQNRGMYMMSLLAVCLNNTALSRF